MPTAPGGRGSPAIVHHFGVFNLRLQTIGDGPEPPSADRPDLDIIRWWQWMRGAARDGTPQACCRGPGPARCLEWLRGPSGTSPGHLTSALQLSLALTPSLFKAQTAARLGEVINYTLSYRKNITSAKVLSAFSTPKHGYFPWLMAINVS